MKPADKIKLKNLEDHDANHGTSLVRELEMAVDRVVTCCPQYSVQFFKDCWLYNLPEARRYLVSFIAARVSHPNDEQVAAMNNFSETIERVLATVCK